MSDPYSEALQSQAAQLALAHLPPFHMGLTRICFLKNYPIISVMAVEHAYSFDSTYNPVDVTAISIEPTSGWLRFRIGQVITPEGLIRTTYSGGLEVIPDDVSLACSYYVADQIQDIFNAQGGLEVQMGKRRVKYSDGKSKSWWVQKAEDILINYKRFV